MKNINNIRALVLTLQEGYDFREEYLKKVPADLQSVVFDNDYSNSLENTIVDTLYHLLPEYLVDDIQWFLYEWKPGFKISLNGEKTYVINNMEDFINYIDERYL